MAMGRCRMGVGAAGFIRFISASYVEFLCFVEVQRRGIESNC